MTTPLLIVLLGQSYRDCIHQNSQTMSLGFSSPRLLLLCPPCVHITNRLEPHPPRSSICRPQHIVLTRLSIDHKMLFVQGDQMDLGPLSPSLYERAYGSGLITIEALRMLSR